MTPRRHDISMREMLVFYYRYRARLLFAFWAPLLLAAIVSFIPAPRYEASSVLIVRLGSEYVYQPEVTNTRNNSESAIPFDRDQIFKSEVAILDSDDLHAQAIKTIGLDKLYPDMVEPGLLDPVVVPVRRFIEDTGVALGIAEPLTDEQRERRRIAKAVMRFDKRLDIALEKESAVITVSFQHKDAAVAVQALDTLLRLYFDKRKQLYLEPRAELARAQVDETHRKALAAEHAVETYKRDHKIYSLSDQRSELLQARGDVDKELASVSSAALEEKREFFNRALDRLGAEEREFNRLQSEKQIAEDEYALSVHKWNEALAYDDLERERLGSVRIIEPPTAPAEPRRLQWLIILAGLFIAVISVFSMAALTEFLDGSFLTPEQLERKTGIPVLAVISLRD